MRIIAGPCQHESLAQSAHIAQKCKEYVTSMVLNISLKQVLIKQIVLA